MLTNEAQYHRAASAKLEKATQDTRTLINTANRLLTEIFKAGYGYQKCGVQLSAIQPVTAPGQVDLFDFAEDDTQSDNRQLMATVDQINRRFPKAVSIAATGIDRSWKPKAERKSPRYTTDWRELVKVGWLKTT